MRQQLYAKRSERSRQWVRFRRGLPWECVHFTKTPVLLNPSIATKILSLAYENVRPLFAPVARGNTNDAVVYALRFAIGLSSLQVRLPIRYDLLGGRLIVTRLNEGDGDFYDTLNQIKNVLRKDLWVIGVVFALPAANAWTS
jgi:hypothetical protein